MTQKVTIGDCTLYLADCKKLLPAMERHLIVSDPPYGIGFQYGEEYSDCEGEAYTELLKPLTFFKRILLQYPEEMMQYMAGLWGAPDDVYAWCYNSNTNRQMRLWGFWGIKPDWNNLRQPSKNPMDPRVNSDVRSYDWCADLQQVKNVSPEKTAHPCQIPVELVKRVILLSGQKHILDPFMGSGTTGVACAKLGVCFTGIEIEPEYFDIACKRIEEAYSQPDMLLAPVSKPQETMQLV